VFMKKKELSRAAESIRCAVEQDPRDADYRAYQIWLEYLLGKKGSEEERARKAKEKLVPLAKSWAQAPELKIMSNNFENRGYDLSQRAYILKCEDAGHPSKLECKFKASNESPVVNACLYIQGWGDSGAVLMVNGQELARGIDYRLGHIRTLEGCNLIVWIKKKSTSPVEITLEPEGIHRKKCSMNAKAMK